MPSHTPKERKKRRFGENLQQAAQLEAIEFKPTTKKSKGKRSPKAGEGGLGSATRGMTSEEVRKFLRRIRKAKGVR